MRWMTRMTLLTALATIMGTVQEQASKCLKGGLGSQQVRMEDGGHPCRECMHLHSRLDGARYLQSSSWRVEDLQDIFLTITPCAGKHILIFKVKK